MSRAVKISEDVRRQTGNTTYRCMSPECGHVESSSDMRPQDMMRGYGTSCSSCGEKTEAIGSHTSLPGGVFPEASRRGR